MQQADMDRGNSIIDIIEVKMKRGRMMRYTYRNLIVMNIPAMDQDYD